MARALVQLSTLLVICVLLVPVPLAYRLSAAAGGVVLGLLFSVAYMVETTEHRVTKAGYPSGTAERVRSERAERERVERRAPLPPGGGRRLRSGPPPPPLGGAAATPPRA